MVLLQACNSSKSLEPKLQLSKFSALSELEVKCEQKIRSNLQDHSIKFIEVDRLKSEVDLANKFEVINAEEKLTLREQKAQFIEYGRSSTFKLRDFQVERVSLMGLNEKNSFYFMFFEISLKIKTAKTVKTLTQRYGVNNQNNICRLELTKSNLKKVKKIDATSYQYNELSISSENEVLSDIAAYFQIEKNQELEDFREEVNSYKQILSQNGSVSFIPKIGIVQLKISPLDVSQLSFLGGQFNFKNVKINTAVGGQELIKGIGGIDEDQQATYVSMLESINYSLPFNKFFSKAQLGEVAIDIFKPISKLDADYQSKNSQMKVISNEKLDYESLHAYWKVLQEEFDAKMKVYKYVLQENSLPQVYSKTTNKDLISNKTIQADLPEIIAIASEIEKKTNGTRINKIKAILEYLANNYSYDFNMLNKNTIRPLTTKEALERKKGVCQHYAVLFTAIARALKIPSRIIWGYSISGNEVVSHAWVEVEVSENLWQVVEPQSRNGLTDTQTRFYFPMSRATFLEDKEGSSLETILIGLSRKFEFIKVN
jgi:hypothetical protein